MDDVRAIMDAIGSHRAVLLGFSEGCPMSVLFAATYPERVSQLILIGGFARSADRLSDEAWLERREQIVKCLGHRRARSTGLRRANWAEPEDRPLREVRAAVAEPGRAQDARHAQPRDRCHRGPARAAGPDTRPASPHRCAGFGQTRPQAGRRHSRRPIHRIPGGRSRISGSAIPRRCTATSRNLSQDTATAPLRSWSACLQPCCSPTSWIPPAARPLWVTSAGAGCWTTTTSLRSR